MKIFPRLTAEAVMAQPKSVLSAAAWVDRPNHAGSRVWVAPLLGADGVTIPGLTMHMEVKAPIVTDVCLFLFSLMLRGTTHGPRLYQLEVCPGAKRSHIGPSGNLHGPHEHIGEEVVQLDPAVLNCASWGACCGWFIRRCNISAFPVLPP